MTPHIRRALVAALLVAGGIVAMPAAAAQAAGVTFAVTYSAVFSAVGQVGCAADIVARKGGTTIASGTSASVPEQTVPNVMEAWDFVRGGAPVQLQISATTGEVITYAVPDRAVGAPGGHFARNIFYPIYRWRIVADNQVSGWVVPATDLQVSVPLCH